MKKLMSTLLSIVMILCVFASAVPSFALTYNDFLYEIVNENIVIIGYNGTDTIITIPAEIDGISVIKVDDSAFKNNETLTSVIVSEGVEDIGASAFENCTALATITLPETIIHIGEKAIYNTAYYNNTGNWRLKKTPEEISGSDTIEWDDIGAPVLQYLYLGKNLIEVELEGSYSVKYGTLVIADGAFKGNKGALSVGFPDSVVTVGINAFYGCEKLHTISNLDKVDYIGDNAFAGCLALNTINISYSVDFNANVIYNTGFYNNPENWENGALYIGTRVVATKSPEAVIKDGATSVISGAFGSNNVVIPASVTSIHENAFTSTENVKIYGFADTYAETFANENNIPFIDLNTMTAGDVNYDGKIDRTDYNILCSVSSLKEYQSYAILLAGDMNEDGTIDGMDVIILDLFLNDIGPSTIKGDADGNGEVNEDDYILLVKISIAKAKVTDNYMLRRCDLNGDGAVDGLDALYLDLALNGLVAII